MVARWARALRTVSIASLVAAYQPSGAPAASRLAAARQIVARRLHASSVIMQAVETPEATADVPALIEAVKPIVLPSNEESDTLLRIRHTSAHVMAMAVQRLFKDAKVTIGPWIENGFYYDFDYKEAFLETDLRRIKKEMDKIISMKLPLVREEVSADEARRRILEINEPYKLEILDSIVARDPTALITIYHIGDENSKTKWWDLCAGPHVAHTGMLPADAISLDSIAGAYWRGDETKPMLQRIYGSAWENKEQLAEYARLQAEAKRRDHRMLGKQLDLFSIQQDAGGGLVFWHPKGARMRNAIETFWKDVHINGPKPYELLYTPHMASLDLWKTSGHFDFYKDGMFDQMEVEGAEYQIRPMNCPFHVLVYKDSPRSYRDLPLRWAELGTVYRYERSGTLHGLFRVRGFTQDDAHIFCLPEQLSDEILGVLDLTETILSKFGFTDYKVMLSTRPEKSVGSDAIWDKATTALTDALDRKGWTYDVDEGGGAFYGPKIDVKIRDAIGRMWQCSTIQCDFNLPDRFGLEYIASSGKVEQPIMVHRAIFGSMERFFGVLTESTAGDFPFWLAPTQLRLLPVSDDFKPYCEEVVKACKRAGVRAEVDIGGRSLGKQIKISNQEKIPMYAVVGAAEVEGRSLALTSRRGGDLGSLPLAVAIERMAVAHETNIEPHEVGAGAVSSATAAAPAAAAAAAHAPATAAELARQAAAAARAAAVSAREAAAKARAE